MKVVVVTCSVTTVLAVNVDAAAVKVPHVAAAVVVDVTVDPGTVAVAVRVCGCTKSEHASEITSHTKMSNCLGRPGIWQALAAVAAAGAALRLTYTVEVLI